MSKAWISEKWLKQVENADAEYAQDDPTHTLLSLRIPDADLADDDVQRRADDERD